MRSLDPFDYFEPEDIREASELLSAKGEKACILAGGIDLIPRLRKRMLEADHVINIQKIPMMDSISFISGKGLTFGAMTRLRSLEKSSLVQDEFLILYEAIHQIASTQVKFMGTAVGNLCVGTPASDLSTVMIALDAQLTIANAEGQRNVPLSEFYLDYYRTDLEPGELVTHVFLPIPHNGTGTAFMNLVRTRADIAKVSVAVSLSVKNGVCSENRIAVGAAAPTVFRASKAETLLKGRKINTEVIQEAAKAAAEQTQPITDLRSTAGYRKEMTRVLVGRTLEMAHERARLQDEEAHP